MKNCKRLLLISLSTWLGMLTCQPSMATPAQILIIRHAEKPMMGIHLSARGVQRANALVGFFKDNAQVNAFGAPIAIYVAKPDSVGESTRAQETMTPSAQSLNLKIVAQYDKTETAALVQEIMSSPDLEGRTILICWVRNSIIDLIKSFGARGGPADWPEDVYDQAYLLKFIPNKPVLLINIPEHLLPGDTLTKSNHLVN